VSFEHFKGLSTGPTTREDYQLSALHDFDLKLCDYVRYNIAQHFEDPAFAEAFTTPLPPELAAYLLEDKRHDSGGPLGLLLNADEFERLHSVADFIWLKHGGRWEGFQTLHALSTPCTGEISCRLAPAEARTWAEACEHFSAILESRLLTLPDGIWTVYEWIGELRWYLKAMGETRFLPIPDGPFPTPTNPAPTPSTRPEGQRAEPTPTSLAGSEGLQASRENPYAKLTPPQLARRLRVSPDKVLTWIKSGELRAVNVATNPKGRPRFVIDPNDVEAFEARRSVHKKPPATRRRRQASDDVIEFF
jgi:hypothetical protein